MNLKNLDELRAHEGKALPPTDWITVTQEMIHAFAEATLDFQWIHVDVERAKKYSPFKTPVAHGFMSVSLASRFLEMAISIESMKMGLNYGLNKIRFPHPVPVDSRLRMHASIAKVEDYPPNGVRVTWDTIIEIEGIEKPACVAQFITLMFE